MTDARVPFRVGSIISADLTVPEAEQVRDFYQAVIGWQVEDFEMGGYNDYLLKTADGQQPVGGVCHARGDNQGLPPVWLVYVSVADLEQSAKTCVDLGGKILTRNDQYAVIQDPAGAILAITREPDTAEF